MNSYAPYSTDHALGVGAFWSDARWRWFVVYAGGRPIIQRGPMWLSDYGALAETAGLLEATQGRGYIGTVTRWDWDPDAMQWRQVT